jgi:hypothetical protein
MYSSNDMKNTIKKQWYAAVPGEVLECQKPVTVELFEIIYSQSQIQESL